MSIGFKVGFFWFEIGTPDFLHCFFSTVAVNFENPDLLPPWKNEISSEITDLSNYFVNSDGDDFITLFMHALEKAQELKLCVNIEEL